MLLSIGVRLSTACGGDVEPKPDTAGSGQSGSSGAGGGSAVVCGDGVRDSASEECDDSGTPGPDYCDESCVVSDVKIADDRGLARGQHSIALTDDGVVIATVAASRPDIIDLAFVTPNGSSVDLLTGVAAGTSTEVFADPVVAALPGGDVAVAFTDIDGDGDGLGVALRRVGSASGAGSVQYVSEDPGYDQADADMVWTGTELVVAWSDFGPVGVMSRVFDADLKPKSGATLLGSVNPIGARVALSSVSGGQWAAAWHDRVDDKTTVHVRLGDVSWAVGPLSAGPVERPSLAQLDDSHLILVVTEGPAGGDSSSVRWAVLSTDQSGNVAARALPSLQGPTASEGHVAVVDGRVYVAWRDDRVSGSGDLFIQEFSWTLDGEVLAAIGSAHPLPRLESHRLGDEAWPVLVPAAAGAESAIAAVWEDRTEAAVWHQLIPTPMFREASR